MRLTLVLSFLLPAFTAGTTAAVAAAASDTPFSHTISDTRSTYPQITRHNDALSPLLKTLCSSTDFFKYYKLNLFTKECPYFNEDGAFCGNRACAVDTIEEDEVPEIWRASVLGKLTGPTGTAASNLPLHTAPPGRSAEDAPGDPFDLEDSTGETCVQDPIVKDDRNFCVSEDEDTACVYVSLVDNEERYTGYHGSHAHAIWGAIYKENCFESHGSEEFAVDSPHDDGYGESRHTDHPFAQVLRDPLMAGDVAQDTCVEKRIFYRIISGMHASISTHICASYLNQLSGRWEPNATCFDERLRSHPERVSNIYFNYVLVSRAVAKVQAYLNKYTFCSGDPAHDAFTSKQVQSISALASNVQYDEMALFEDRLLKDDFRNRFRNISMLMDCVGCDKCRLWGKVQTAGYGAALKILFDDGVDLGLRRGEIVALFNTYARLSISLDALKMFGYATATMQEGEVAVSDTGVTQAEVLSSSPENPQVPHAGPKAPGDRLAETLTSIKQATQAIPLVPRNNSVWRSLLYELSQFGHALKFIGMSYVNLPRNLWYHFFVSRQESSFWDFVFAAREDAQEL